MKKALIVIALVIILLCSLAVSGIPFNLVVGKEGMKRLDAFRPEVQFNFPFEFSKTVHINTVEMEAFREYNRCSGLWFAELYDLGMPFLTTSKQDICTYSDYRGAGCWRTVNLEFASADKVVIRSEGARSTCSEGNCHPRIVGDIKFMEGKKVPFAVSSKNGSVSLGTVGGLLGNFVFTETTGSDLLVVSDNPRVLVWLGSQDDSYPAETKTDDDGQEIWACYDGDQNKQCDFAENSSCAAENGDFYNGVCCGVDVKDDFVSYWNNKAIHGLCGRITAGDWAWVTKENFGEIFNLNYYPGKSIVSDGEKFISCTSSGIEKIDFNDYIVLEDSYASCPQGYTSAFSKPQHFNLCVNFANAALKQGTDEEGMPGFEPDACDSGYSELGAFVRPIDISTMDYDRSNVNYKFRVCAPVSSSSQGSSSSQFVSISTKYGAYNYLCSAGRMFECSGGRPFSTSNVASLGSDSRALSHFFCPSGMVAYWPMEGVVDGSISNTLGAFAEGNVNSVSFVPGHVGNAARFSNPVSDIYVDHPTVNLALPSLSIEAWIRPSSIAGRHVIFNKEGSYELYLDSGILKASLYSDGSPARAALAASNPITNDVWSHVALVYDGSVVRMYHNGQSVDSAPLNGKINASASDELKALNIGARSFMPIEPFEGLIDEVALYSTVLSQDAISRHYSNATSYCGVASMPDVYYCASDGDWTKDLDAKDEPSCSSAGFNWTGHKCCSEMDDVDESYSDSSTPAVPIKDIVGEHGNVDMVSDYTLDLNSTDSFVVINGPARISILRSSFRRDMRDEIIFCEDKEVSSFDLIAGQSKRIVNHDYSDDTSSCTVGRTVVSSLPVLAWGGCFKKNFYPSGSFLYEKSVINANGEFVACKQRPAGLQQYDFIRTQATPCGKPINDVFPGKAAVCLPAGNWQFIDNAEDTSIAQTTWNPADFGIDAYQQGCCPDDRCWNGTGCQPGDTYYSVANKGFVCK